MGNECCHGREDVDPASTPKNREVDSKITFDMPPERNPTMKTLINGKESYNTVQNTVPLEECFHDEPILLEKPTKARTNTNTNAKLSDVNVPLLEIAPSPKVNVLEKPLIPDEQSNTAKEITETSPEVNLVENNKKASSHNELARGIKKSLTSEPIIVMSQKNPIEVESLSKAQMNDTIDAKKETNLQFVNELKRKREIIAKRLKFKEEAIQEPKKEDIVIPTGRPHKSKTIIERAAIFEAHMINQNPTADSQQSETADQYIKIILDKPCTKTRTKTKSSRANFPPENLQ